MLLAFMPIATMAASVTVPEKSVAGNFAAGGTVTYTIEFEALEALYGWVMSDLLDSRITLVGNEVFINGVSVTRFTAEEWALLTAVEISAFGLTLQDLEAAIASEGVITASEVAGKTVAEVETWLLTFSAAAHAEVFTYIRSNTTLWLNYMVEYVRAATATSTPASLAVVEDYFLDYGYEAGLLQALAYLNVQSFYTLWTTGYTGAQLVTWVSEYLAGESNVLDILSSANVVSTTLFAGYVLTEANLLALDLLFQDHAVSFEALYAFLTAGIALPGFFVHDGILYVIGGALAAGDVVEITFNALIAANASGAISNTAFVYANGVVETSSAAAFTVLGTAGGPIVTPPAHTPPATYVPGTVYTPAPSGTVLLPLVRPGGAAQGQQAADGYTWEAAPAPGVAQDQAIAIIPAPAFEAAVVPGVAAPGAVVIAPAPAETTPAPVVVSGRVNPQTGDTYVAATSPVAMLVSAVIGLAGTLMVAWQLPQVLRRRKNNAQ